MTTLSLERFVHPARHAAATPRIRAGFTAHIRTIGESVRAARAFENAVSPSAQARVMEQFASSIAR